MRKKVFVALLTTVSGFVFSQDYTKKIAKTACECFTKVKAENPDAKNFDVQLGVCMINAAEPYSKELKKDYNLDILGDESSGDKVGEIFAKWILRECPDTFIELIELEESSNSENQTKELLINGTVTKIEKDNFIIFHVVGDNKTLNKLYWVSTIESNLDLPKEYGSLLNKKVNISYYTAEIFDVKINDYRKVNIISGLKTE